MKTLCAFPFHSHDVTYSSLTWPGLGQLFFRMKRSLPCFQRIIFDVSGLQHVLSSCCIAVKACSINIFHQKKGVERQNLEWSVINEPSPRDIP